MSRLEYLSVRGFKSIADASFEFGDINVCIGANGAGKSNLIDIFWLLGHLASQGLRSFVRQRGGADLLLRYGRKRTPTLELSLRFANDAGDPGATTFTHYVAVLAGSDDNLLYFDREAVAHTTTREAPARWDELGAGHTETVLARVDNKTARQAHWYLSRCKPYHFHDTSPTARIRGEVLARDDRYIRTDGANLAAYLHRLRASNAAAYRRIVLTIRQIAPFFDDFELALADDKTVILAWHDVAREYLLSPLQLSDGTLRSIALVATLLRPRDELPLLMAFDEPELGLHPYALEVILTLMSQLRGASQLLLATQSTFLVDRFDVEDIVVVEAGARKSTSFHRLTRAELAPWLEEYSLGELWQKNVLGGKP